MGSQSLESRVLKSYKAEDGSKSFALQRLGVQGSRVETSDLMSKSCIALSGFRVCIDAFSHCKAAQPLLSTYLSCTGAFLRAD